MNERIRKLYKTVILSHSKQPYKFGKRENSLHLLKAYNPICGDKFELYVEVEDGNITDLGFHGYGCSISKASTSVLATYIEGKSLKESLAITKAYLDMLNPDIQLNNQLDEDFLAFAAAREFPGRLTCASLSWEEIHAFLEKELGHD
ncbi:MAG: Fe-S cluster assembly sulfur transfer protein SufU [Bacteroidota bacterium]